MFRILHKPRSDPRILADRHKQVTSTTIHNYSGKQCIVVYEMNHTCGVFVQLYYKCPVLY